MKHLGIKMALLSILFIIFGMTASAQTPTSSTAKTIMQDIFNKYENVEGVDCTSIVKGEGLEFLKLMLRKQFGKSFIKGVTCIMIIDYGKASDETRASLHTDLDRFLSVLEEFKLDEEEDAAKGGYTRCFAASSGPATLSDFVFAREDSEDKMLMYMTGVIRVEE